jgi:hypothetical protein
MGATCPFRFVFVRAVIVGINDQDVFRGPPGKVLGFRVSD